MGAKHSPLAYWRLRENGSGMLQPPKECLYCRIDCICCGRHHPQQHLICCCNGREEALLFFRRAPRGLALRRCGSGFTTQQRLRSPTAGVLGSRPFLPMEARRTPLPRHLCRTAAIKPELPASESPEGQSLRMQLCGIESSHATKDVATRRRARACPPPGVLPVGKDPASPPPKGRRGPPPPEGVEERALDSPAVAHDYWDLDIPTYLTCIYSRIACVSFVPFLSSIASTAFTPRFNQVRS